MHVAAPLGYNRSPKARRRANASCCVEPTLTFLGCAQARLKHEGWGTRESKHKNKKPQGPRRNARRGALGYKATARRSSRNDKPEQKQTSENKTPGGAFAFAAPPGGECSHLVANWLTATRPLGLGFAVNPGGK
jgi:hypothetical protein